MSGDDGDAVIRDGGIRDTSAEALARLTPSFRSVAAGGRVTAGNASQITDGAASVLIMSMTRAKQLGLAARARFVDFAVMGDDPQLMLTANIPATLRVLERSGLTLDDIDRFEVNEAFASTVIAWLREVGAAEPDLIDRVNVNGGAIALGHPLGRLGDAIRRHPGQRTRTDRRPLRTAGDVRGWRHGERDDSRTSRRLIGRSTHGRGYREVMPAFDTIIWIGFGLLLGWLLWKTGIGMLSKLHAAPTGAAAHRANSARSSGIIAATSAAWS